MALARSKGGDGQRVFSTSVRRPRARSLRYDLWLPLSNSTRTSIETPLSAGFWITALAVCRSTAWERLEQTLAVVRPGRKGVAPGLRPASVVWSDRTGVAPGLTPASEGFTNLGGWLPLHHKWRCDASLCTSGTGRKTCRHVRCGPCGHCSSRCSCGHRLRPLH